MNDEDRLMQELIDRAGRPKCPDHVVASILNAIDAEPRRRRPLLQRIRPDRIGWIAAAAAALLLIAVLPGRFSVVREETPHALTQAEIDEVRAEVETAFAIISRSMVHGGRIVDDQIRENVTGQLLRGLRTTPRVPAASPAEKDDRQSLLHTLPLGEC